MEERRQVPRWHIGQKLRIRMKGAMTFVDCYVHDLNLKGMQVTFPMELPNEHFVRMNLSLSKDVNVDAEVQIPWHRQAGGRHTYGLAFSQMKDTDKDRIYEYMCSNFLETMKDRWWEGAQSTDHAGH